MKGGGRRDEDERGGEAVEVSAEDGEEDERRGEVGEGDSGSGGEKIKATSVLRWPR